MNKAALYKRSNPHRNIDNVVVDFGGFVNYYDAVVDGSVNTNRDGKIKKRKISIDPRADKIAFSSGR